MTLIFGKRKWSLFAWVLVDLTKGSTHVHQTVVWFENCSKCWFTDIYSHSLAVLSCTGTFQIIELTITKFYESVIFLQTIVSVGSIWSWQNIACSKTVLINTFVHRNNETLKSINWLLFNNCGHRHTDMVIKTLRNSNQNTNTFHGNALECAKT